MHLAFPRLTSALDEKNHPKYCILSREFSLTRRVVETSYARILYEFGTVRRPGTYREYMTVPDAAYSSDLV
jgi:hypothetical protein